MVSPTSLWTHSTGALDSFGFLPSGRCTLLDSFRRGTGLLWTLSAGALDTIGLFPPEHWTGIEKEILGSKEVICNDTLDHIGTQKKMNETELSYRSSNSRPQ